MKAAFFPLVLALLLGAIAVNSAPAASDLLEIKPGQLKRAGLTFDIRNEPLPDGTTRFTITVTEDTAKFSRGASVALSTVEISPNAESIHPHRELASTRAGHAITCTFVVEPAELEQPNICFVFTNYAERMVNGELMSFPSADFCYARLANFARKKP